MDSDRIVLITGAKGGLGSIVTEAFFDRGRHRGRYFQVDPGG